MLTQFQTNTHSKLKCNVLILVTQRIAHVKAWCCKVLSILSFHCLHGNALPLERGRGQCCRETHLCYNLQKSGCISSRFQSSALPCPEYGPQHKTLVLLILISAKSAQMLASSVFGGLTINPVYLTYSKQLSMLKNSWKCITYYCVHSHISKS